MITLSKILSALEREYLRDNLREFEETVPMTLAIIPGTSPILPLIAQKVTPFCPDFEKGMTCGCIYYR